MDDDRLTRRLRSGELEGEPRPEFVTSLHADLAARLGLAEPSPVRAGTRAPSVGARQAGSTRAAWRVLLLAAAVALLGAALTLSGVGAAVVRMISAPTVLEAIRSEGALRVAIRPDTPQVTSGSLAGFDVDVAGAIADRLGVELEPVLVPVDAMPDGGDWALSMPSRAVPASDAAVLSSAYYRWPLLVLTREGQTLGSLRDLAGGSVCVAEATAAEAWARGTGRTRGLEVRTDPPAWTVLAAADEQTCLDELAAGRVDAAVTGRVLPGDLGTLLSAALVGDGPVAHEPVPIVVSSGKGVGDLRATVDEALDDMRQDGTLTELSRRWFGGEDLTAP